MSIVTIERKVLEKNDAIAAENRALFESHHLFVINLVSSPGAGKTRLLERTLERLKDRVALGVIEGDVQTDLDARRVARYGAPVVQIVTNGACHLDAGMVRDAAAKMDLDTLDGLIIENVGNLVCPAAYDLGEATKVVLLSTTEGEDKPLKYPAMFRNASVLVITKMDLAPYLHADIEQLKRHALWINPDLQIFETSCESGDGLPAWCDWLVRKTAVAHA